MDEHDKELVEQLTDRYGLSKEQASKLVETVILPWIDKQFKWGGKFDRCLEQAAGPDA